MSHLQANFIAKTKARMKQSQAPRAMPRKMILEESRAIPTASRRGGGMGGCWYFWDSGIVDHRVFTLKK